MLAGVLMDFRNRKKGGVGNNNNGVGSIIEEGGGEGGVEEDQSSFLWTLLRDPTTRATSNYFFLAISRKREKYSDEGFKYFLEDQEPSSGHLRFKRIHYYLALHTTNVTSRNKFNSAVKAMPRSKMDDKHEHPKSNSSSLTNTNTTNDNDNDNDNNHKRKTSNHNHVAPTAPALLLTFDDYKDIANGIMLEYDFIAITERFDESMVVLSMLLGKDVTLGDMLYLSSKTAGGYDDGYFKNKCSFIQKSFVTEELKNYFNDGDYDGNDASFYQYQYTWEERTRWDRALYEAANRSMDRTIEEVLGRTLFEQTLQRYKEALRKVNEKCAVVAKWPCTSDGIKRKKNETNCLGDGDACAYECIEEVAKEMDLF